MKTLLLLAAATFGAIAAEPNAGRRHIIFPTGARMDPAAHLREAAAQQGLSAAASAGIYLHKSYRTEHNGVTHNIYRQQFQGVDVHGMEWVVNVDRDGNLLNSGGELTDAPAAGATLPDATTALAAARAAVRAINPKVGGRFLPAATSVRRNGFTFAAGPLPAEVPAELTWFPFRGQLIPAWALNVPDAESSDSFEVLVEAGTDRILSRHATTFYQRPPAPKALVFTGESPQPNPNPGVRINAAPPPVNRVLVSLEGDPKASPQGWVAGTSTAGNNVIAGQNILGVRFATEPRTASLNPQGEFSFPYDGGAGSNPLDYHENATTNLFYWVNRAHDFFYSIGFDEAAGNFQTTNFTQAGAGGDPMYAYTHFSVAGSGGASTNNAFFTRRSVDDGADSMIAMFMTSGGVSRIPGDTALDAGVVIHEYTHGVSTRLVRSGYTTHQGGAMGEAWSDFFALELLTPEGAPLDGSYPVGEYFNQNWGLGIRTRPYTTNIETNPIGYQNLGRVITLPQVHADGEIWMQSLWDMRANLIRQFGETEGRRRTRLLVIDGMKLAIPAPTMVDARDAILLADRTSFKGESQKQIWAAFAKRGMGALAYTPDGDSTTVIASFDAPGEPRAAYYGGPLLITQSAVVVVSDPETTADTTAATVRSSSGDVETISLRRRGSLFTGSIRTNQFGFDSLQGASGNYAVLGDGSLQVLANDAITVEYKTAVARSLVQPGYARRFEPAPAELQFPRETRLPIDFFGVTLGLPFDFPFYGKTYSTVDVLPSRLGFGLSLPVDSCFDDATFRASRSIAPLFTDMVVSLFDPTGGVFASATADSVTLRWKGVLLSSSLPPMNYAATLFRNGTIRFDYGSGNQQLHTALPGTGCGRGPVAGLSPGLGNYVDTFTYPASFDKAQSVIFEPPVAGATPPEGYLDAPTVSGTNLLLTGGTLDRSSAITRADVLVDGIYTGLLNTTVASAAVCAKFGLNAPCTEARALGGPVNLIPRRLTQGAHKVQLRITNALGATATVPAEPLTFNFEPQTRQVPVGAFESPAADASVTGTMLIRGYVYLPVNRIARVDYILDGGPSIGGITYGLPRPDICGPLPASPSNPNCPAVGFQGNLNTVGAPIVIPDGEHTLTLRVTDSLGNIIGMPETAVKFKVNNGGAQPPTGVMIAPEQNSTISRTTVVWGYGWSPFPARRVTSAILVVDGANYQTLSYGEERAEQCATIENAPAACPNIGFSGLLNTERLANGLHTIGVRVVNDRGESVVIPTAGRNGVNVFVKN